MLNICWGKPFKIKDGGIWKYCREWFVPNDLRSGFFLWWKKNRYKFLSDGFRVYKKGNEWYLSETKLTTDLFKQFDKPDKEPIVDDNFKLLPAIVKNSDGLRPWQVDAASFIISAINHWGGAVDGSEMGVGKTYTSIGVVRELDIPFVVVCPKAVMSQWKNVIDKHFKISNKCLGVINYEMLIRGKPDSTIASYVKKRSTQKNEFVWKIPSKSLIIWDEAHKLKNWKTKSSKTCISAFKAGYKQLFLSASIATTPLELRTIGTCLKMFKGFKQYYEFLEKNGCYKGVWGMVFNNDKDVLKRLHREVFDKRGVRLKRDSIVNFPECEILVEPYSMDDETVSKINEIYDEMHRELKNIENKIKKDNENELTIRIRARQKCEILKIPLIQELVEDSIEAGMSVVVFLNFSESIDALSKRLDTTCIFDGRIDSVTRERNKQDFQENKERIIIINSSAGGVGLSLGDETGNYPRISLISPDDSAVKMKQVQGRIWRENSKSKSIQKFIFISDTVEEVVSNNVKQKLDNLSLLNDGDLKI